MVEYGFALSPGTENFLDLNPKTIRAGWAMLGFFITNVSRWLFSSLFVKDLDFDICRRLPSQDSPHNQAVFSLGWTLAEVKIIDFAHHLFWHTFILAHHLFSPTFILDHRLFGLPFNLMRQIFMNQLDKWALNTQVLWPDHCSLLNYIIIIMINSYTYNYNYYNYNYNFYNLNYNFYNYIYHYNYNQVLWPLLFVELHDRMSGKLHIHSLWLQYVFSGKRNLLFFSRKILRITNGLASHRNSKTNSKSLPKKWKLVLELRCLASPFEKSWFFTVIETFLQNDIFELVPVLNRHPTSTVQTKAGS